MLLRSVMGMLVFCMLTVLVHADTLYVTDRILLGLHEQPQEDSVLLKSIVSGTAVEVIESRGAFSKIKLIDGTEGWVSSSFLKKEKPAVAELDALYKKHQEVSEALKLVNDKLGKQERELQVRRDELSNAKTKIKELTKQLASGGKTPVVDTEQLQAAEQKIAELTEQLAQAKAAKEAEASKLPDTADVDTLALQLENSNLQARIASALANLQGETVPTPEQLAAIRPEFPAWYSLLVILALIIGAIGGIVWMDYRNRMRHGGFRV